MEEIGLSMDRDIASAVPAWAALRPGPTPGRGRVARTSRSASPTGSAGPARQPPLLAPADRGLAAGDGAPAAAPTGRYRQDRTLTAGEQRRWLGLSDAARKAAFSAGG
jgi:hypothetical protein